MLKRKIHPKKVKKYWTNSDKYYKMEHYKNLLNDSTASKFVTRKFIEHCAKNEVFHSGFHQ